MLWNEFFLVSPPYYVEGVFDVLNMSNYRGRDSRQQYDHRHEFRQQDNQRDKGDFHYYRGKQNDIKKFNNKNDFKRNQQPPPPQQTQQRNVQIQNTQQGMRQDFQMNQPQQPPQMLMNQRMLDRPFTSQNRNVQVQPQSQRQASQVVPPVAQNRMPQRQQHAMPPKQMSQPITHPSSIFQPPAIQQQMPPPPPPPPPPIPIPPTPPPPPAPTPTPVPAPPAPLSQQVATPVLEKLAFNFISDIPSPINISTNSAEIAIITEYFGDKEFKDKDRAELLESRKDLSETLLTSLKSFSDDLQKSLPILEDIPTNTQLFRSATLNRSDLMSRQTHNEFLHQDFRNKLCLMYPDEITAKLWTQTPTISSKKSTDWRNC